jgi:hypothetical protein
MALAAAIVIDSAPDTMQRRLDQLTAPYAWSVVGWEVAHLGDAVSDIVHHVFSARADAELTSEIRTFLDAGPCARDQTPPSSLPSCWGDYATLRSLLASSVAMELREHGAPTIGHVVFPPVTLSLTQSLRLLVVSPRDEIRQAYWELFDERFPTGMAPEMEATIEAFDMSALVVDGIAVATWPTLIPSDTPPSSMLQTVAHEWTHTALFFTALGRAYGSSPQARAINETTADTVGTEIGDALMRRSGIEPRRGAAAGGQSAFNERMRALRQRVDELLAQRDIAGAEAYMEEQRLLLVADGYRIRKLNQAYFAFHGNYAEGPAATTEVPDSVRAIRAQSGSLAEFLGRVGQVTSLQDLRAIASP